MSRLKVPLQRAAGWLTCPHRNSGSGLQLQQLGGSRQITTSKATVTRPSSSAELRTSDAKLPDDFGQVQWLDRSPLLLFFWLLRSGIFENLALGGHSNLHFLLVGSVEDHLISGELLLLPLHLRFFHDLLRCGLRVSLLDSVFDKFGQVLRLDRL